MNHNHNDFVVPLNDVDRTQEVLSYEHVLMEAASAHEDILLPIVLTLRYEEVCVKWQFQVPVKCSPLWLAIFR